MRGKLYAIILAGGVGSRFWPLSRIAAPKQILKVAGEESLLKETIKRLSPLIPKARISIVTSAAQSEIIRLHLSNGKKPICPEFIVEPFGRNTAPAIGLAAITLLKKDPDAIMLALPSDHLVKDGALFRKTLHAASRIARKGRLVTFGIKPEAPETAYGYIKASKRAAEKTDGLKIKKVEKFVEKPDIKRAKKYLKQGNYYWNSGIFVWKASLILDEIRKNLPNLYENLLSITTGSGIKEAYDKMESISIDHGVLEKTENMIVVEAPFKWSDMGSLSSLKHAFTPDNNGNIIKGRVVDIGSRRSFMVGSERIVATIGLKDMIVVDTPDATLICPMKRAEEVKAIVNLLKKNNFREHETHLTMERPWGFYTVLERGNSYKIKKITVFPGCRLSLQTHNKRSEHWVVIQGIAKVRRGDEVVTVSTNESTYIPRGVKHRLENPSRDKLLEIIEVQNGSYVEEDDILRLEDDYKRGLFGINKPCQPTATSNPRPLFLSKAPQS